VYRYVLEGLLLVYIFLYSLEDLLLVYRYVLEGLLLVYRSMVLK